MKKSTLVIFPLLSFFTNYSFSQCKLDYSNYTLVLDEQFDSYGGSVTNLLGPGSIWNAQTDIGEFAGWGVEYYLPSQVSLIPDGSGGSRLRLTAEPLASPITGKGRSYNGSPVDISYKSGMLTLKNTVLKAPSAISPYVLPSLSIFDSPSGCTSFDRDPRGWQYGMFEIRCKIPSGGTDPRKWDTWPAFWLIGIDAELDIIDNISENPNIMYQSGKIDWKKQPWSTGNPDWTLTIFDITAPKWDINKDYKTGDIVSTQDVYWPVTWVANKDIQKAAIGRIVYSPLRNLENEFTTFTAVWTPTKITFFVEGKEVYSLNGPAAELGSSCGPLNMIVDLQIHPGATEMHRTHFMDIEYIRVYKPNQLDYTLPYKSNQTFVHEAFEENSIGDHISISPYANSIAPNTSNPDEIYYRGIDNYIYVSNKIGDAWYTKRLEFDHGYPSLVGGDIKYLPSHDKIIYAGQDSRINLFGRSSIVPSGYYHWYLRDDAWSGSFDHILAEPGSLQVTPDGNNIFFTGLYDRKMHRYNWNTTISSWSHSVLSHPTGTGTNTLIKNDIIVDPGTGNVIYKGMDNRLQIFWKDSYGIYNHAYIDDNWTTSAFKVSSLPSSITFAPSMDGILYIGVDRKIHFYKFVGGSTGWDHQWLPYTYSAPSLGYTDADLAKGSLDWDDESKKLFYGGYDGKIQCFYYQDASWHHFWVDDYWNKADFNTYNSLDSGAYLASIKVGAELTNKSVYHTAHTSSPYTMRDPANPADHILIPSTKRPRLVRFKWDTCEDDHDPSEAVYSKIRSLYRGTENDSLDYAEEKSLFELYPNPASAFLTVKTEKSLSTKSVIVRDLMGRSLINLTQTDDLSKINVSDLPVGIYIVEVQLGDTKYYGKFLKR